MLHLLSLRYLAGLSEVDPHVPGHVRFLKRHHGDGTFLVSGQTVPVEEGGAIVARGVSRARIEEIVAEDPFVRAGVAAYQIVTIMPGRVHSTVSDLLSAPLIDGGETGTPGPVPRR